MQKSTYEHDAGRNNEKLKETLYKAFISNMYVIG